MNVYSKIVRLVRVILILVVVLSGMGVSQAQELELNPTIEAFAWFDRYALSNWPAGTPVQVTIPGLGYTAEPFMPEDPNGWYSFYPGVDIQPGTLIQATNGEFTKQLVVSNLSASSIDPVGQVVSGVAAPGRAFHISLQSDPFPNPVEQDIPVDEFGNWSVQFSTGDPWQWFTRGEMWQDDGDGDVTYAIWHLHQETVEVWLAQNEIRAFDWPLGTELTFTVSDLDAGESQDFYAWTEKVEWMDGTWAVVNAGEFQLKPGMLVSVTDGNVQRETTIQDIQITHFDPDLDLVSGVAPSGNLELRSWEDSPVFRYFPPDENGQWLVDYTQPSVNGITVDVNPGDVFTLFLREPDKDATIWETSVPDARLFGQYTDDHIRFETLPVGQPVNFKILDQNKVQLFETTVNVNDSGAAFISIWDHRLDLQPGYEIIASSESLTKHLVLELVSLDFVDPDENILLGTASPWREVWVVVGNLWDTCGKLVTADEWGNWLFDFDEIGCDFDEEMAIQSYAQVTDAESDTSEAFVNFIEGYHDYDTGDVPDWACNVGGWAVDSNDRERDLQLQVLADDNPEPVKTFSADIPSEGLLGVCGADGSCGFETNLWGLLTPYVEHQITVQALDEETGHWINLNSTPRPLTCRSYDIYVYDPSSGETRQVTDLPDTGEYNPSWSPNGKFIAHDVVSSGSHDIYVTRLDKGGSKPLRGAEGGNDAAWSPNGLWIAFDRRWVGDASLYLVPAAGGPRRLLRAGAVDVDWAPSSRRIVFQDLDDGGKLKTSALFGPQEFVLAEYGETPAWSPDGNWIAYVSEGHIYKVSVNSLGMPLADPVRLTDEPLGDGHPTWSADSQVIVFASGLGRDQDLWRIPAAGGEATWLTGALGFGDYDPDYSRDGALIAYASFAPPSSVRSWSAMYTADLPAGFWASGDYTYQFLIDWSLPEPGTFQTPPRTFTVSTDAQVHPGTVLLRTYRSLTGFDTEGGLVCDALDSVNPDQPTSFNLGWVQDQMVTYTEAVAHFDSLTFQAAWWSTGVDTQSLSLARHRILPYSPGDWDQYYCGFTR